jgi:hypothetical protein
MGETVDFVVYEKPVLVLIGLHAFLLERFPLTVHLFHPP